MQAGIYIAIGAIGLCAAGAVALYCRQRRKTVKPAPKQECIEDRFLSEWTAVLAEDARVFNGLFSGLQRVISGTAKKPEKVLREWCQRTRYKWENKQADLLCRQHIVPLLEKADRDALTKWASLLLEAAAAAGITRETAQNLVLTEGDSGDYVEWDGNDLYSGDEVEIISPAWYQNGRLLEQGQCRNLRAEAE